MTTLIWEPHQRTGGGVLVRGPVLPPRSATLQVLLQREQLYRGGLSRKHLRRLDTRTRARVVTLEAREWRIPDPRAPWVGHGDWIRAYVFATPAEHVDARNLIEDQIRAICSDPRRMAALLQPADQGVRW